MSDILVVSNQGAFWILSLITVEIVKSQSEAKKENIILEQFY